MPRFARHAMMTLAIANATLACALGQDRAPRVAVPQEAPKVADAPKEPEKVIKLGGVEAVIVDRPVLADPPAVAPVQVQVQGQLLVIPAAQADLDPLIQQFTPQLRPILRAELHFAKSVCDPTPEQQKALARDGHKALAGAVKQYAAAQQKMMQGNWRGSAMPDPRKLVQKGMLAAVKAHLSPEQVARYQAELDAREADRKRVAVRSLVAALDGLLVLTEEQRAAFEQALSKDWNEAWGGSLEASMNGDPSALPALPDKIVSPILNRTQKRVWSGVQKNQGQTFIVSTFNLGGFNGIEMEADPLDEAAIAEAEKAAAPTGPKPRPNE